MSAGVVRQALSEKLKWVYWHQNSSTLNPVAKIKGKFLFHNMNIVPWAYISLLLIFFEIESEALIDIPRELDSIWTHLDAWALRKYYVVCTGTLIRSTSLLLFSLKYEWMGDIWVVSSFFRIWMSKLLE